MKGDHRANKDNTTNERGATIRLKSSMTIQRQKLSFARIKIMKHLQGQRNTHNACLWARPAKDDSHGSGDIISCGHVYIALDSNPVKRRLASLSACVSQTVEDVLKLRMLPLGAEPRSNHRIQKRTPAGLWSDYQFASGCSLLG